MSWKRVSDASLAGMLLIVLSPLLAAVAVGVRCTLGAPILFQQLRIGRGGRPFLLFKFRTMSMHATPSGAAVSDQERMTAFGRCLRASSLDEIPELWNILVGDMSLVGPRPLLPEYLPLYSARQARRHEVRPGLTGWAQVNGRNALTWEERFDLDVWYVEHQSIWLDVTILWLTVLTVLRREGISKPGHATMERFRGSPL